MPFPELWPGDTCPDCDKGKLLDPENDASPTLPPTGGDYEFADSSVDLVCDTCGIETRTAVQRRYWLKTGKIEYILEEQPEE